MNILLVLVYDIHRHQNIQGIVYSSSNILLIILLKKYQMLATIERRAQYAYNINLVMAARPKI